MLKRGQVKWELLSLIYSVSPSLFWGMTCFMSPTICTIYCLVITFYCSKGCTVPFYLSCPCACLSGDDWSFLFFTLVTMACFGTFLFVFFQRNSVVLSHITLYIASLIFWKNMFLQHRWNMLELNGTCWQKLQATALSNCITHFRMLSIYIWLWNICLVVIWWLCW